MNEINNNEGAHINLISKKTKVMVSSISKKLNQFENMELIQLKKVGRKRKIYLTETGKEVCNNLKIIEVNLYG